MQDADGKDVYCWGNNNMSQLNVPELSNPVVIDGAARSNVSCAIDDSGLVCWGWQGFGDIPVPTKTQALAELSDIAAAKNARQLNKPLPEHMPKAKRQLLGPMM